MTPAIESRLGEAETHLDTLIGYDSNAGIRFQAGPSNVHE
jgi:hypothetical protein